MDYIRTFEQVTHKEIFESLMRAKLDIDTKDVRIFCGNFTWDKLQQYELI